MVCPDIRISPVKMLKSPQPVKEARKLITTITSENDIAEDAIWNIRDNFETLICHSNSNKSTSSTANSLECSKCDFKTWNKIQFVNHLAMDCWDKYTDSELKTILVQLENRVLSDIPISYGKRKKEGKKMWQCKYCDEKPAFNLKCEYFRHLRVFKHIENGFPCINCVFIATLKHHWHYHWLSKHTSYRPFHCDRCYYKCVSKSMLISHMKTHSVDCSYRCKECPHETKFFNSMKKHLRQMAHKEAETVNADGTIFLFGPHGNERGPRKKRVSATNTNNVHDVDIAGPSTSAPRRNISPRDIIAHTIMRNNTMCRQVANSDQLCASQASIIMLMSVIRSLRTANAIRPIPYEIPQQTDCNSQMEYSPSAEYEMLNESNQNSTTNSTTSILLDNDLDLSAAYKSATFAEEQLQPKTQENVCMDKPLDLSMSVRDKHN